MLDTILPQSIDKLSCLALKYSLPVQIKPVEMREIVIIKAIFDFRIQYYMKIGRSPASYIRAQQTLHKGLNSAKTEQFNLMLQETFGSVTKISDHHFLKLRKTRKAYLNFYA